MNGATCDSVDGSCICSEGYTGEICDTGIVKVCTVTLCMIAFYQQQFAVSHVKTKAFALHLIFVFAKRHLVALIAPHVSKPTAAWYCCSSQLMQVFVLLITVKMVGPVLLIFKSSVAGTVTYAYMYMYTHTCTMYSTQMPNDYNWRSVSAFGCNS